MLCPLSLFLTAGVQTLDIFDFSAREAKKRKSDDINLDSSGCFGCTCHYLRLGTSPKSHESAVDRYCRWRTEELQTEDAVDVKSNFFAISSRIRPSNGFGISLQIAKFR